MPGREKRAGNVNFRISDTGRYLLETLQDHFGLSMASVVEMLLREEARRRGITIPDSGKNIQQKQQLEQEAERIVQKELAMRGKKGGE